MNNCVKVCGKWCEYVANYLRKSLRESRKSGVRVVRVSGKVFGLANWCSGFGESGRGFGGKVSQRKTVVKSAVATVSTYPNTTTTNILRKMVFNNYKKECIWS